MKRREDKREQLDEDLYEELDEEEMSELVEQERAKALKRTSGNKKRSLGRRFPKWAFWLIAAAMVLNVFALIPQTFSVPAIDFLLTSAKLSVHDDVQAYKKAVVVIETGTSKGTGFAVSGDGIIITNHHVVEGEDSVTAAFADEGLFTAKVTDTYPQIDIAILQAEGNGFPFLDLSDSAPAQAGEAVLFIGNPLKFNRIANEGTIIGDIRLEGWGEKVQMINAPVYRGNSGSPVISRDGKVTGIIFATLDHRDYGKVGLFVPVDLLKRYLDKEAII
jgi:S1-C subfamily serine protease